MTNHGLWSAFSGVLLVCCDGRRGAKGPLGRPDLALSESSRVQYSLSYDSIVYYTTILDSTYIIVCYIVIYINKHNDHANNVNYYHYHYYNHYHYDNDNDNDYNNDNDNN